MAVFDAHANFPISTVATAPSPATSGTSLVVAAGHGTRFPTVSFNAVICPAGAPPDPSTAEIVRVSGISTDTFTIARAQEGSSARTVVVGDQIFAAITKKTLTDIEAGANMALICDQLLTGTQASFDTNTILGGALPTGYKHLHAVLYGRGDTASTSVACYLALNNDTGGNYYREGIQVNGVSPTYGGGEALAESKVFVGNITAASSTAGHPGMIDILIPEYTGTTFKKMGRARSQMSRSLSSGDQFFNDLEFLWNDASAVTRVAVNPGAGNFAAGTRFSLYGLA